MPLIKSDCQPRLISPMLSATRDPSSTPKNSLYVSSWNTLIKAISKPKSIINSKQMIKKALKKISSGKLHSKFFKDSRCYTKTKSYIGTSKVQIYFLSTESQNQVILMSLRFQKTICVQHKQAHPTTQVPKYGKGKNITENVIFGQLDAYCTNCAH